MGLIQQLKDRYKGYKEKRFLDTHGCKTWREYERRYDPDVGYMARWTHTYYHGYPYVFPHEPSGYKDFGFHGVHPYVENSDKMAVWCEKNCRGKWRNDWHRGDWDHQGNYEFNGISGSDIMFFAFKEEADYIWFRLVWE
jgi:hypothetical protein